MLSANEWILVPSDHQGPGIPMQYALELLVDHFGKAKLVDMIKYI
jgi:hypothetical protein